MDTDIHVLAVDDSVLDRKVVERLLKNSSYKVTAVDSAVRALEVLGMSININLIITDYCMPDMTGFELLKRVKESSALKEIPVVIMSSENVPSRVKMCMAEGAREFIIKPLQLSDVKRLRGFIYQESSVSKRKSEGFQASACMKRQAVRLRPTTSPDRPRTTTTTTTTRTRTATTTPTTTTATRTRTGEAVKGCTRPSSPREGVGSKLTNGRHGGNSKAEEDEQDEKMVRSQEQASRVVVQQSSKRMKIRHSSTGTNQVAQCDEVATMTTRTRFSAAAAAAAVADADADNVS